MPTMITRAAELARRAPAGPAYLNIPLEVLLEEWDGREAKPIAAPGSTHSSPEEADAAAQLIREARNPVIVTETAGREAGGSRPWSPSPRPGRSRWSSPTRRCAATSRAPTRCTRAATSARGWTRPT
ncbi:hypothetical protein O1M54_47220 [Streptomyces diastatochromogenes]|nr:hypothetical protein [Streptomyces diastatochromogenes]